MVKIEGRDRLFCETCGQYVPPIPVGKCPHCGELMVCWPYKRRCVGCLTYALDAGVTLTRGADGAK